jgi:hypothetical protein
MPFKQVSIFEDYDQMHLMINNVKVTFFNYPYPINHPIKIEKQITIPSLLTLSAMKAFALGRRAKWKDYVDLYFILKDFYAIEEVANEAIKLFPTQFSEKLFRQQLAFHKDIDYSEPVEYIVPEVSDKLIKEFLINRAIDIFKP